MHHHQDARSLIEAVRPDAPVIVTRPHAARRAARFFVDRFAGTALYAVKANPSAELIRLMWAEGITHFDVASIAEARLVRGLLPDATLAFMHPVKTRAAIAEAYHALGCRIFSLDTLEELAKIVEATGAPDDLDLCVRLRVDSEFAEISLASKFGVDSDGAVPLLQAARQASDALGVCFHVGSQAMSPIAYVHALERVRAAIAAAAVTVDIVNVGGGFPALYPGMEPPALQHYFDVIERGFEALPISYSAELWCEPGRALAAEYSSLVVRVERRRGDQLFVNDGAYGALFDAAHLGWRYPTALLRDSDAGPAEFALYGPTCDDADHMAGPFLLPADVAEGDYVEIANIGAYGAAMATRFNGFGEAEVHEAADEPGHSMYTGRGEGEPDRSNVVAIGSAAR